MVNWTFVYQNYKSLIDTGDITEEDFADLGWARYPETVEGEESKPPIGGIDIGVGAFSKHSDFALEAAACVTSSEAQVDLRRQRGPDAGSRTSAYESPELAEAYPAGSAGAVQRERRRGGPAAQDAPTDATISAAVQSVWHSPTSVDPDKTPEESAKFLREVLDGKALL